MVRTREIRHKAALSRERTYRSGTPGIFLPLLLFLLSIPISFAVGYFFQPQKAMAFSPTHAIELIDDSRASPIGAVNSDVHTDGEVFVREITLWNSGNLLIDATDVRQPLWIVLNPGDRIISHRIIGETKSDTTWFDVHPAPPDSHTHALQVTWNRLAPKSGVKIQFVYSGSPDSPIRLDGHINGVERPFDQGASSPAKTSLLIFLAIALMNLCVTVSLLTIKIKEERPFFGLEKALAFLSFLAFSFIVAITAFICQSQAILFPPL